jgi:hypothetical protein
MYSRFLFDPAYSQWEIDGALVGIGCNPRTMEYFDGHLGKE